MNMTTLVNLFIVIMIIAFMISGYKEGFFRKLIGILSFFVVGFLCWYASDDISRFIFLYPVKEDNFVNQLLYNSFNRMTIFIILFFMIQLLLILIRPFMHIWNHIPLLSTLNRIAGVLLGGFEALLILSLITMTLRLPFWKTGNAIANTSYLRYVDPINDFVLFYTKEPIKQLEKIDDALDEKKTLTADEVNRFHEWLLEKNIRKEDADRIIEMLRMETYER